MDTQPQLTAEERLAGRIAILEDAQKLLPRLDMQSTYGQFYLKPEVTEALQGYQSLQSLIQNDQLKVCQVCAMGALFMGYVNKFNNVDIHFDGRHSGCGDTIIINKLAPYFDYDELRTIEVAYEGHSSRGLAAYCYKIHIPDNTARMGAILDNCLRNNSEFKPEQDVPQSLIDDYALRADDSDDDYEEDDEDECDYCGCSDCDGDCEDYDEDDDDDDFEDE